jgi:hypothetical protein
MQDARLAVEHFGGDPVEVVRRAKDPEFIRQIRPDWTPAEASHYARTGEETPGQGERSTRRRQAGSSIERRSTHWAIRRIPKSE